MSISLLLEMAVSSNPDRTAVVSGDTRLTTQQLSDLADGGAGIIAGSNANHVVYVGTGGAMLPPLVLAFALGGLALHPNQLPPARRRHPGPDPSAARPAGGRQQPIPRHGGGRWSARHR